MRKIAGPFAAMLALGSPAFAVDDPVPLPHYLRSGPGLACMMNQAMADAAEAQHRDGCIQIGPLTPGMQRADLEKVLGKPAQSGEAKSEKYFAYGLQYKGDTANTYAVVFYSPDGHANTIQVTGDAWPAAWKFSGLTLGDSQESVTAILGQPMRTQPSEEPGTVVWDYSPWTFSLEIKGGKLSSVRLWEN